jgi:CheY-like chemotaxis protein
MTVLERMKALDEQIEVILVTAVKEVLSAVAATRLGAFDSLSKPFEEEEVLPSIGRALEKRASEREVVFLRSELTRQQGFDEIVGQHHEMQKLYQLIAQVARTTSTVLITGESGTGKELVARAIHRQGPRKDKPFVPVDLPSLTESLTESSCSATSGERSPAPSSGGWGNSSWLKAARFSWMRLAPSNRSCRRSSSACSRNVRSSASEERGGSESMCGSSPRPT